jgi:two-component system chemotaxis response regulator CheB
MKNSRVHVLIVDDSLTIRAMMETVFQKDPAIKIVGFADSAEEAETMLRELSPDVILLDIKLPGIDGLDFLSKLKMWHSKPVIMLSSLTAQGSPERVEALRRGAAGSFGKAKAISEAPKLLKMIKDAAHGTLRGDPEDMKALAVILAAEKAAAKDVGVSA